jgi:hypothetical protein
MAFLDCAAIAVLAGDRRSRAPQRFLCLTVAASVLVLGSLLVASPAAAATCKFAPFGQINIDTGVEPQLLIDGTCIDPDYNESTFVIDKTEQLTFQVPDGPLIPYTEVTGHFPATKTLETLPPGIRQSPTTFQQNYVFRFPAKEYWRNRSFEQQHPTGGGVVDNRMAFTNGAYSVNWMSAGSANSVASHRHEAAATKVAKAYANKLYGNTAKIYSYFWGCSGGGIVSMAAAENVTGVWDGVQVHCMGPSGTATFHSFHWQALYTMAIPQAKRDAIAQAAAPGGTGDIYAGLNDEEKSVLNEFISAGYPLPVIGNHFKGLDLPLVDPVDIRVADPTYEDDFWSKPGYTGVNPPNYLKAAIVDGWATITGITRDAAGNPTAIQFDPATVPALGSIGDAYLEYWVYAKGGKQRLIDPVRAMGPFTENKRRYSLQGKFDADTSTLALTGTYPQRWGPDLPYINSKVLLDGLAVGSKIRINNRFILAMYFYPRYSNIPGARSYDQYRNADGSAKYPQRQDISFLASSNYRTMGGRIETGDIKTKVMIIEGRGDNLSWPLFNASYAQQIQRTLGATKANAMMRFYLHDNGRHAVSGGEPGIWQQSMQDMMAWVEKGIAPPPSTSFTIRNGQVIPPDNAAERHGLQPVMNFTANGVTRATIGVNQPVNLAGKFEMPPKLGEIVQYGWTIDGKAEPMTVLDKPQPLVNVSRTISFPAPGTYVVRLTVNGQRDGLVAPANQTLMQNFKEVRVVVQ